MDRDEDGGEEVKVMSRPERWSAATSRPCLCGPRALPLADRAFFVRGLVSFRRVGSELEHQATFGAEVGGHCTRIIADACCQLLEVELVGVVDIDPVLI